MKKTLSLIALCIGYSMSTAMAQVVPAPVAVAAKTNVAGKILSFTYTMATQTPGLMEPYTYTGKKLVAKCTFSTELPRLYPPFMWGCAITEAEQGERRRHNLSFRMVNSGGKEIASGEILNAKALTGALSFSESIAGGKLVAYHIEFWGDGFDERSKPSTRESSTRRVLLDSRDWILPAKTNSIPADWYKPPTPEKKKAGPAG